jgi:hypothetical protein
MVGICRFLMMHWLLVLRIVVEIVVKISHYPATILLLLAEAEAVVTIMEAVVALVVIATFQRNH